MAKKKRRNIVHRERRNSDNEDEILISSASTASSKAVRSSMALGISIKVIKDHNIITINPDKTTIVIRKISKLNIDISTLKKGMILEKK